MTASRGQAPVPGRAAARVVRPTVRGRFLFLGEDKLYVRGVTYGPFAPREWSGGAYAPEIAGRDFAAMAVNEVNAIRTYTVPPRWLLDLAWDHDLHVLVGLPWEQHVAFLDERGRPEEIEERVRAGVRACAGHPAVLGYAVGNEIPSTIARWHGRRSIERYLERLYLAAKEEDPDGLVTYVNYPSTEYLQLPFLDLVSFNVYLESRQPLERYLARLQNVAGDRPLLLTELGLDSRRHGAAEQADVLGWQVRAAFAGGCAGAFVFAWTDEWHRGGYEIEDWDFGLTDRERRPKPALATVRDAFADVPFSAETPRPRISVVVCTHNGSRTLGDCLAGLAELHYPDYEVIVVSDGSTDESCAIAADHDVRLLETERQGLGRARNVGLLAATGEIVAYLDDDARPDPHWLAYLAHTFATTDHAAVGGPNTSHPADGEIGRCIHHVPGGPTHVLLTDTEAEHIPGCNMAFRKTCLEAIGGFDSQFRAAGDDVDVCWRIRDRGWTLGFSPGAVVWHHRRASVRGFWKQQRGYGAAEGLLERKWPERYSLSGHVTWAGRLYGNGSAHEVGRGRWRVYYGTWGTEPFQRLYRPEGGGLRTLPRTPEWYLVIAALASLSLVGTLWRPLLAAALPLFALAVAALLVEACLGAARAPFAGLPTSRLQRGRLRSLTALLFLLQPLARLRGRLGTGLGPVRGWEVHDLALPRPRTHLVWSERWEAPEQRLRDIEAVLRARGAPVIRGGDHDRWDLEVRGGTLGGARARMVVEEHGAGRQLVRYRWWPRWSRGWLLLQLALAGLAAAAGLERAWAAAAIFAASALLLGARAARDCAAATGVVGSSVERRRTGPRAAVRAVRRAERTRA